MRHWWGHSASSGDIDLTFSLYMLCIKECVFCSLCSKEANLILNLLPIQHLLYQYRNLNVYFSDSKYRWLPVHSGYGIGTHRACCSSNFRSSSARTRSALFRCFCTSTSSFFTSKIFGIPCIHQPVKLVMSLFWKNIISFLNESIRKNSAAWQSPTHNKCQVLINPSCVSRRCSSAYIYDFIELRPRILSRHW